MKKMNKKLPIPFVCALLAACGPAFAQTPAPLPQGLRDAVQKAISTHPDVTARLHALRAAEEDVQIVRGAFLPRVDLTAEAGRTRDRIGTRTPQDLTFGTTGAALSATQLLWDGLNTYRQVEQFGHARLTRWHEFLDTSDRIALEAVNAYVDVARLRALVKLAEDHYVQHRQVAEQIQSRVGAGVGRRVDLEQANARLALAETNLTNETANLHDVTERFQRVVGQQPALLVPLPQRLDQGLPGSAGAMLEAALRRNNGIAASIENLRAAQEQARVRESAFQPTVQAQLRSGAGHNFDRVQDQKRDTSVGVALNWNLFNGGSDRARVRQAAALIEQATDQRDKVCRDTRQSAAIAFNDARRLAELTDALTRHVQSTERARDAYRQQYDIGQRSLLDLLNAENELYGARRSLANAEHDRLIAQARAQATASNLVNALGLTRSGGADDLRDGPAAGQEEAAASRCPLIPTQLDTTPRGQLDARALALLPAAPPAAAPALTPLPPTAPAAAAAPAPATANSVSQQLVDWSRSWSQGDVARHTALYAPSFKPETGERAQWLAQRAQQLRSAPAVVKIDNVQRRTVSPTQVETTFDLTRSDRKGVLRKTLTWQRSGDDWRIVREVTAPR